MRLRDEAARIYEFPDGTVYHFTVKGAQKQKDARMGVSKARFLSRSYLKTCEHRKSAPCERNDLSSRGLAPQYFRRGGA